MCVILDLAKQKKRQEIEAKCREACKAFEDHYAVAVNLLRSEYQVKCAVAKATRDQQLRQTDSENDPDLWIPTS